MKFLNTALILLNLSYAHAFPGDDDRYRCDLTVKRIGKRDFKINGHIIAANSSSNLYTLLTLEPPEVSGINISARVVFSRTDGDDYRFMQLHNRGSTAEPLSHLILDKETASEAIFYQDEYGLYELHCRNLTLLNFMPRND